MRPPKPGVVLRQRILARTGITQAQLARGMGISAVRLSQILNGHAPISTEMALRLESVTNVAAEEWRSLQVEYDLYETRRRLAGTLDELPQLLPGDHCNDEDAGAPTRFASIRPRTRFRQLS